MRCTAPWTSTRQVASLARAQPLHRLPRRRRVTWSPLCQLLGDWEERLTPYRNDFRDLSERLRRQRGRAGMAILRLPEGPDRPGFPSRSSEVF